MVSNKGEYTEPFTTETLKSVRKAIRTAQQDLKIYKWAADHDYNGNDILAAYELYRPGIPLVDNTALNQYLQDLESHLDIGFFELADFEESLLNYFAKITKK
ncbi:hypothetical protein [Pediococcus damnosus]|uniref:Type I restriction-modification system, restriction subunit R n=1 Tax=Pediococcus damnosus TaxID=51663 RepID=A0AAC9B433_9LACO|nr:hypothetical protein [Pediococcus damnosus]AMV63970.1 Type I restriction-modification system, restriction subunit R [Pediococcus damnosus]